MTKRHFNFTEQVRNEAFFRQGRKCAVCGESLEDMEDFGHHVIPDQSGDPDDAKDRFLASVDNCVMICNNCHYIVHAGGLYAVGAVPPPEYYRHANANRKQQKSWTARVHAEYARIMGKRALSNAAGAS